MTERRIAVLGAGGHAKVVLATALAAGYEVLGLYDDRSGLWGTSVLGFPVAGDIESAGSAEVDGFVVGVGSNGDRQTIAARMSMPWASLVHPSAIVHPSVVLDDGSVVFAGAVIQPDSIIGSHVIVNTAATVDHDCRVGDFAHLAPGSRLAGHATVGRGSLIGLGSSVLPGITVGEHATVGANAAVAQDVPSQLTVTGVPARPLSR